MLVPVILLIASAAVIYLSCEFFVNGIEWVGHHFRFTQNATGTILAAFGTALPESVVTFIAVVFGQNAAAKEIGVGAALGGPLVLATIAYAVVGITFLVSKEKFHWPTAIHSVGNLLARDQQWFMGIFVFKVALGLVAFAIKPWLGVLFLLAYAAYVRKSLSADGECSFVEDLEPLKICPKNEKPAIAWAIFQTCAALVVIFVSSHLFVHQLEAIGPWLGMPPQLVALLLSPIATELPETLNAVIWVRQKKLGLALANISGAMMIQATVPSALAILFTPWMLDKSLVWAAVVTMFSIAGIYLLLRKKRLGPRIFASFGLLYLVFAGGLYFVA
jgi:cation:H+ antiporter